MRTERGNGGKSAGEARKRTNNERKEFDVAAYNLGEYRR
jgi:hypothetical protein